MVPRAVQHVKSGGVAASFFLSCSYADWDFGEFASYLRGFVANAFYLVLEVFFELRKFWKAFQYATVQYVYHGTRVHVAPMHGGGYFSFKLSRSTYGGDGERGKHVLWKCALFEVVRHCRMYRCQFSCERRCVVSWGWVQCGKDAIKFARW